MLKFDQQQEFEDSFRKRFGNEIFEPGGVRTYLLGSYKTEMMNFCVNWIRDHAVLTHNATKKLSKEIVVREKIVTRHIQPAPGMRLPMAFVKDGFVRYLKSLQLYAIEHEDAMTAREIGRKLHLVEDGVIPRSHSLDGDTDTDI